MPKDTFVQNYTPLTDLQKEQGAAIKQAAQALYDIVEGIVPGDERSDRARIVNVGKTQLEIAVMCIIKGVYMQRPEETN